MDAGKIISKALSVMRKSHELLKAIDDGARVAMGAEKYIDEWKIFLMFKSNGRYWVDINAIDWTGLPLSVKPVTKEEALGLLSLHSEHAYIVG